MLLTDDLSDEGRQLLKVIYRGTPSGTVEWPVWQWVEMTARRRGVDAVAALNALPTWLHYYRPVTFASHGMPQRGDRIGLSIHGLHWAGDTDLTATFLAALTEAIERRADFEPSPSRVVAVPIALEALTAAAQTRSGTIVRPDALEHLLQHEPATWMGLGGGSTGASEWDVAACPPAMPLFEGVQDVLDYLRRLDVHIVGTSPASPFSAPSVTDPIALHDGLDYLSLVWRQRTGAALLRIPRAISLGELALPVLSGEDFLSRCSQLDDLLKALQPGGVKPDPKEGSLAGLERRLREYVAEPESLEEALAGVRLLRDINRLRVAQQHSGYSLDIAAIRARRNIGLATDRGDWASDWDRIRGQTTTALRKIRTAMDLNE